MRSTFTFGVLTVLFFAATAYLILQDLALRADGSVNPAMVFVLVMAAVCDMLFAFLLSNSMRARRLNRSAG